MPVLTDLPVELLHFTISQLRPFEIEPLARTYNKRLYYICIPFLTRRLASRRNAKRMARRFKPISKEPPPNLDFMDLNGDFRWFLPFDEAHAKEMKDHHSRGVPEENAEVDELIKTAQRLGLSLPEAFTSFMRSSVLQDCTVIEGEFSLEENALRKCPHRVDKWADGYIIRFLCDEDEYAFYSLYIDSKGHCVLDTEGDPYELGENSDEYLCMLGEGDMTWREVEAAKAEGVKMAAIYPKDVSLVATDFEEFLVVMHYRAKVAYLQDLGLTIPTEVKDFFSQAGMRMPLDEGDEEDEDGEENENDDDDDDEGADDSGSSSDETY